MDGAPARGLPPRAPDKVEVPPARSPSSPSARCGGQAAALRRGHDRPVHARRAEALRRHRPLVRRAGGQGRDACRRANRREADRRGRPPSGATPPPARRAAMAAGRSPPATGRSGVQTTPRSTASTRTALHRCRLSAGHRRCGRWRWGRCECWRPGSRGRGDNVRRLRESRQDVRFSAVCVHCLYRGHLWRAEPASRDGGCLAVGVWSDCYGLPPARRRASPTREGAGGKAVARPEGGGSAWVSTSAWRAGRGGPDRRTGGDAT